ncbi:hypothetical protein FSARC_14971 [Fusarium sarcochroum]|uniref:Aminoglycoside phosphotransferase domain-containing protein n=1 Tax=Fusarium sarcochroum TaxID=1208366 RepID=A0A8H4SPE0_9HYPO|nr:hypothetical protein FSARC_14971 [Fusarium sarcochroum]
MGYYDEIIHAKNDDERRQFISKLQEARDDIVAFVNTCMKWEGTGQYRRWLKGSFNIGYVVARPETDGQEKGPHSVFIRFPIPGRTYTPWSFEKVENEVMIVDYLREHTTIPLPRVYFWGPIEDSPWQLAPFMIMEFMEGECLDNLLKKPTKSDDEPLILNPDIEENKIGIVYRQVADCMVQLSQLRFSRIGAIFKDQGYWAVTGRPMTYDMKELVAETGFPAEKLTSCSFARSSEFFRHRGAELWSHLDTQQNICETEEDARQRFIARHRLAELIPKHCIDNDTSFTIFGDDMCPFNMLADPETFQITAVLDFEFTNAMPAQYLYDIPSWLLLASPHCWLERDDKSGFEELFIPQMELFIQETEKVESELLQLSQGDSQLRVSAQMLLTVILFSGKRW